ncbi:hypothetical protein [Streptomyces sp. NPDC001137]|uniref:hypothetical protein n=1 Tax=Streptomyces sp. NPDC001137 TaxID=3154378 RepID=UPI00331723BB
MARREPAGVDTWVRLCNEIVHHVLNDRTRTVHLLWVITIPPAVLGGVCLVFVEVLIPHPAGWLGVAGCGVGAMVTARLRAWLRGRSLSAAPAPTTRSRPAALSPPAPDEETAPDAAPQQPPTSPLLP